MSDKDKGFASMDKDKVKEIAAKGGHASHKDNDHNKNTNSKSDDHTGKSNKSKSDNNN